MPIRLRLVLWYGSLCALALLLVSTIGYGWYVRDQYVQLDRFLILSARFVTSGVRAVGRSYALEGNTRGMSEGIVVVVRIYTRDGTLQARSPNDPGLPPTSPTAPLASPATPAYRALVPLAVFGRTIQAEDGAAFGTLRVDGQRWRRYVVRVRRDDRTIAYVEALTPLGMVDVSVVRLARILFYLTAFTVVAVAGLGWLAAGRALGPITRVTLAARDITRSRDLSRRVEVTEPQDEVGRLAGTFNAMLASLEDAWQSQQRFVADASHELRAPLTVMRGNLELLRRHPGLPVNDRLEVLTDIERETARLGRLVADLLLLAQSDAGVTLARRDVDLRSVALEAFRHAKVLASGQRLVFEAAEDADLRTLGDADRLQQLLLVLLDNAIKYTPAGKSVTLRLSRRDDGVEVVVRDEGVGIAEDALPHVFDRFYRSDVARSREVDGTGLGLAIARWIVDQHHGRIELRSSVAVGTTVTVTLPHAPSGATSA